MKLQPQDLEKLANRTLEHYNQRAEEFWEGTRDHNVSQNIEALLQHIEGEPPFTILDFGCGHDSRVHLIAPLPSLLLKGAALTWGCLGQGG